MIMAVVLWPGKSKKRQPSSRPPPQQQSPSGSPTSSNNRPPPQQQSHPESDDRRPLSFTLPALKLLPVNEKQRVVIDLLLAGKAVGSGKSLCPYSNCPPLGPGNISHTTKEDIEKSLAQTFRLDESNHFKEPTRKAIQGYKSACQDTPWECTNAIARGMPVWLGPFASSDPEESDFMKGLLDRANACANNVSKRCLIETTPYTFDLDDYGPPRMQRALGKLLAFLQDMRQEANVYEAKNAEEEGMRKTMIENQDWQTLRVRLYSEFKKRAKICGDVAYACSGGASRNEGVYLPSFPDPEKDLYVFIHEVGHAFRGVVSAFRSKSVPSKTCGTNDWAHDDFWHRTCVFLSNLARRVLARRGIVKTMGDYKQIMRPSEGYHKCFVDAGWPSLDEPGTWTL